jgi:hypothetical protein
LRSAAFVLFLEIPLLLSWGRAFFYCVFVNF